MSTYENNRQRSEAANQAFWSFMDAYAEAIGEHPTKNDPETRAARKIAAEAFGYLTPYPVTDEERATVAAMVEAIADRWTQDHEPEEAADRAETAAREVYQRAELEAFLGEYVDAYDVDAIEDEATETDPKTGAQLWTPEAVRDLMSICERHELKA
jgi:hypothetical protein